MKQTEDGDEASTFRRAERNIPSSKLEEIVSATVLKCAKERFRKRNLDKKPSGNESGNDIMVKKDPLSSGNESMFGDTEPENEEETNSDESKGARRKPRQRTFKPTIATDDDVSYEFIRPSTRAILQKLDQTLNILHDVRMTSAQNLVDSGTGSSSEDEDLYDEAIPSRKPRSRATSQASIHRTRSRSTSQMLPENEPIVQEKKKSNRGRKPKYAPQEGESERDFLLRRAKEMKKKLPVFSDVEDEATTTAAENIHPRRRKRRQPRLRESERTGEPDYWMQKKLERLNMRDWSDVMGAAALAGFSPKVIARATQRCADLFGQGMEMHTISETGPSSEARGIETKRFIPGEAVTTSSSESEDEDDGLDIRLNQSISRHSSVMPSRLGSPEASGVEGHRGQSPRKRQKRSRSRGPAIRQYFCPHIDCDRALRGFDRSYNFQRHIKYEHGEEVEDDMTTEEAENDVLDGGVHRDGFLEPIRARKGWRAYDTKKRARKVLKKQRQTENTDEEKDGLKPEVRGSAEPQVKVES